MMLEKLSLMAIGLLLAFLVIMIWTDDSTADDEHVVGGVLAFLSTLWIGLGVSDFIP